MKASDPILRKMLPPTDVHTPRHTIVAVVDSKPSSYSNTDLGVDGEAI